MKIKLLDNISEIPIGQYEGYYWCSGAKTPNPVHGNFQYELDPNSLYIQEAMLWDRNQKISIMVQYTHRPVVMLFDLSDINHEDIEKETIIYTGHRLQNNSKLMFFQFWEEENDSLCINMPVLKMKAQIFIGYGQ